MFGQDQWLSFFIANIITILVFSIVYFLLKETTRILGRKLKMKSIISIGTIVGFIITIVYIYVSMNIQLIIPPTEGKEYFILSPSLILVLIVCVMIDRRLSIMLMMFQLIAMLIVFPWALLQGDSANNAIAELGIEIIFYSIVCFGLFFIKTKDYLINNNGYKILLPFVFLLFLIIFKQIILFVLLTIEIENTQNIFWVVSIISGYYILFFICQITIIFFIEKLYSNFNKLETFSVKDDISFYKMALAQQKLGRLLDEEKISIGSLVLFDVKSDDIEVKNNCLKIIKEETENEYSNPFYFKATNNYYGSFFELDSSFNLKESLSSNKISIRSEDDSLYKIAAAINKASKINDVEITATCSIYGVHSNSLTELIEYCIFLNTPLVSRANINSLVVYDFSRVQHRLKERSKVLNFPFDISDMNISFVRGIGEEGIYYPDISFNKDQTKIQLNEILNKDTYKDKETILRYTSYQSLRLFDKEDSSIVIFYDMATISKDKFSVEDFIKKIERHKNKDLVIIGIYYNNFKKTAALRKKLDKLRANGIKFAIIIPEEFNQEAHDFLQPDYILDSTSTLNPVKTSIKHISYKTNAILLSKNIR